MWRNETAHAGRHPGYLFTITVSQSEKCCLTIKEKAKVCLLLPLQSLRFFSTASQSNIINSKNIFLAAVGWQECKIICVFTACTKWTQFIWKPSPTKRTRLNYHIYAGSTILKFLHSVSHRKRKITWTISPKSSDTTIYFGFHFTLLLSINLPKLAEVKSLCKTDQK